MTDKTILTPEMVGDAVKAIEANGDTESQHGMLDDLWELVLRAIAERRAEDPSLCAHIAVRALEKVPERWYA